MDRAQRVDGENMVICLVIMFTPGVIVVKMSKMVNFLYFLLMPTKNQIKCYGLLNSELPLARYQPRVSCSFIIFC